MVVETHVPPFFEWLLGPTWHDGALFHWISLIVALVAAAIVVGVVVALRKVPASVFRAASRVLGVGAAAVVLIGLLLLVGWLRDIGPTRRFLKSVAAGVLEMLEWLLGSDWFLGAVYHWLLIVGSLAVAGLLIGWVVSAMRSGPARAMRTTGRVLGAAVVDLVRVSPRRVGALTWLAVKESIRRRVVVGFAIFLVVLLFAAWFLNPGSGNPARLYLSVVLTTTSYLVLLLTVFLSALSLPADFKSKTLHTVVTKPVRPNEIVLGRVLGFTVVGTGLLVAMGLISYVFVVRGLKHDHEVPQAALDRALKAWEGELAAGAGGLSLQDFQTTESHDHRHEVRVRPQPPKTPPEPNEAEPDRPDPERKLAQQGRMRTDVQNGHYHEFSYRITEEQSEGRTRRKMAGELGPHRGMLLARVPIYGELRFVSRDGKSEEKGISVGDEWAYRDFIEGASLAAAIWTFQGITPERFPRGLPLEMTIEVFRTTKGDTEGEDIPGTPGSLSLRNPKTGRIVETNIFVAKEHVTDEQFVPRTLIDQASGQKVDLFEDLVVDGRVEVWLRCLQPVQYFGAARADLYVRAGDASFELNLAKGYCGIWLQMVLLIGFGVAFSTFIGAPVAVLATAGALVGGLFSPFMADLAANQLVPEARLAEYGREKVWGGGPIESFYRLVTQQNVVQDLDEGVHTDVVKDADVVLAYPLWMMASVLPDFGSFSHADHVAYGFDISWNLLLVEVFTVLGYLLPVLAAGYFFLKTREVAR